jgi:hypothetical protein
VVVVLELPGAGITTGGGATAVVSVVLLVVVRLTCSGLEAQAASAAALSNARIAGARRRNVIPCITKTPLLGLLDGPDYRESLSMVLLRFMLDPSGETYSSDRVVLLSNPSLECVTLCDS